MRRLPLFGTAVVMGILACRPAQTAQRLEPVAAEPMPRFPDVLRAARLSGVVELAIPVAADGSVTGSPRAIESTHDLFLIAVRNAVRRWRFRPVDSRGALRPDSARVRFTFAI
ncbi:MAG TPA: TonB family protein, partial [Longimicrobiales bacterium]|nr:TonB family protein [Longimicrobiales bacterium]